MAYRLNSNGSLDNRTFYLYGYSFALNSAKTAVSLTLPKTRNVIVLAVDVSATGSTPTAAAPTFTPAAGTYTSAQSVTLASTTPGASLYYTTNGTTPTTASTLYSGPISVSATTTITAIAAANGYLNSPVATAAYVIGTPAAAPTFSPAAGTYTSTQSVNLSDSINGASIYYTTNGTTPTTSSTLYTGPITVSSTLTIEAIATASGFLSSPVASATYLINTGTVTEVPLTSSANVDGIANNGSAVPNGGLDADGSAYSETLLGTTLMWNGNTYSFGSADVADAVANATITLPAGSYTTLTLLGTGANGNQTSQTFTVNYSDGTSTSFTQSVSDWFTPQNYAGETEVLSMAYRLNSNGSLDNRTFYLYGYSFALNSAKTAVSLTLPKTRNVIVLAVDVH
jgi:hypothetical protein